MMDLDKRHTCISLDKSKTVYCLLCGAKILGKQAYRDYYCSRECHDIDKRIDEDVKFNEADKKID